MGNRLITIALFTAALLATASISFAVDVNVKTPYVRGSGKDAASNFKASAKARIIDINTATEAELKAIPGIGAAYAAKIIAGRPYANKAQLKSRKILPSTTYEQVKELIIARMIKK